MNTHNSITRRAFTVWAASMIELFCTAPVHADIIPPRDCDYRLFFIMNNFLTPWSLIVFLVGCSVVGRMIFRICKNQELGKQRKLSLSIITMIVALLAFYVWYIMFDLSFCWYFVVFLAGYSAVAWVILQIFKSPRLCRLHKFSLSVITLLFALFTFYICGIHRPLAEKKGVCPKCFATLDSFYHFMRYTLCPKCDKDAKEYQRHHSYGDRQRFRHDR